MHRFHLSQILKGRHKQPSVNRGSEKEEQMEAEMARFMENFKMQAGSLSSLYHPQKRLATDSLVPPQLNDGKNWEH